EEAAPAPQPAAAVPTEGEAAGVEATQQEPDSVTEDDATGGTAAMWGEESHIVYKETDEGVEIHGIYSGKEDAITGRDMVSWLRNKFPDADITTVDEAPDSSGFWTKMEDEGLIGEPPAVPAEGQAKTKGEPAPIITTVEGKPLTKKQKDSIARLNTATEGVIRLSKQPETQARRKYIDKDLETIAVHARRLGLDVPKRTTYYNQEADIAIAEAVRTALNEKYSAQPTAPSPAPIVPAIKPGQAGPVSLEQKAAEQSPGASAGTAPGFPATESAGRIKVAMGPKGKPISAREIIDFAKRAFNVTMRGVATHRKRALGWYDPHAVGIRLKDVRSITTAIHEVGHYLDWHTNDRWSKKPGSKAIADELMAMGKALYGDTKPPGGYKSEGWAEFTREYLTGEDAESIAPNLHKWFTETYLAKNPEMAKNLNAIKGMIENWRFQGAEARVESQINRKPIKGTIRERLSHLSLWADTMFRDELAPLRVRLKEAGVEGLSPSQDPVELSVAYADKAGAKARHFVMEYTTDLAGNRTGEGLKQVLGPVRKEMKPFTRWIIAKRALWLHKRGINPGISQADAQFVYDKYKSEAWEKVATNITEWNHRLLDYLHDSGAMDSESLKKIKELNPIYVPFMRAFAEGEAQRQGDGGKGIAKVGKPVKAIKGSGREIIDPFESMIQQAERIFSTAHKSMVARSLAKIAERPGMAAVMWKVPAPTQAVQFSAEQLKKDIVRIAQSRLGLDPDVISSGMMDEWDEVLTVYYNASQYYGKDNIVSLVIDGNRQFYEVDPDVYRVMEGLDQYSLPWFMSVFGKAARTVRLGATGLNASFGLVRNFIRDSMTFSVLAKHAKLGPVSAAAGVVKDIARTEPAQKFKAMGGKMAVQVLQDRKATQNLRGEVVESIVVRTVLHPIDALRELFGITEAGVRIAEFEAALKAGEDIYGTGSLDAAVYALNQAQDVTTNFTRHGRIAKVLNQMIPFFNAALQGPDKIVRTFRERPVATAIKAIAGLTVPALLMWWWNKDEDWYKALDASEKARYLHFRVPGTAHIMRIPIPFELGHIFQSIPIAALDARYNNDPGEVRRAFEEAVRDANPTDWPALVGPVVDVMQNKDWADRPIVTESMSRKLPEDQYKPWTTELMREIGATLDASPAQLEYLVNSYSGGLYGRVARTFEMGVNRKEQPSDWPVVGTLFMRDAYRPNRKIAEFYDAMEQLSQKDASDKATIEEQSQLRVYRSISRKMSPYWTALREDDVPDERKKELYAGLEQLLDLASEYAKKQ
ncbi:MAG TPA: LPD38 domain-containing protein, partial [Sedimentisphaerales bacterium]|nr:LPD38 domain-containing protein [Sedimentisphaerales bacterium]